MGQFFKGFGTILIREQLGYYPGLVVYLNGKPIEIFNFLELMENYSLEFMNFNFLRNKIKSLIPPDAVFLNSEGIEIKKEYEENIKICPIINEIHLFSQILHNDNNFNIYEKNNISLDNNDRIKLGNNDYKIILYGYKEKNEKFIEMLLNFVFDFNHQEKENKIFIKDLLEFVITEASFNSPKGNFKIYSIIKNELYFSDEIKQKIKLFLLEEKNCNLIIFNNIFNDIYDKKLVDIWRGIPSDKNEFNNLKILSIIESINLQDNIDTLISKNNKIENFENIVDKNIIEEKQADKNKIEENLENKIDLMEYFPKNISLIKLYYNLKNIKEKEEFKKMEICLKNYNKIQISKIYDYLKESPIKFDLKEEFKKYEILNNYKLESQKLEKNIDELSNKLYDKERKLKKEVEDHKRQIDNDINVYNKINKIKNEIECLNDNKININKNHCFLIPFSSSYNKYNDKIYTNKKNNNICKKCKYNCHINCDDYLIFKSFCGCFDWSFKCKNCPNKCSSDNHELSSYKYIKYDYKTIDNILSEYNIRKSSIKYRNIVSKIIEIKKQEIDEILKAKENELKEEIKIIQNLRVEESSKKKKIEEEIKKININFNEQLLFDFFEELNINK